jgi:hypothetical protein
MFMRTVACIDEEAPEGVNNDVARQIGKAVGPGVADRKIGQEKAILVASWALAVSVSDSNADCV